MIALGPSLRRKLLAINYTCTALLLGGSVVWWWSLPGPAHPPVPPALKTAVLEVIAQERRRLENDGHFAAFSLAPAALATTLPEALEAWSRVSGYHITAREAAGGGLNIHILPDPAALRTDQVPPRAYSIELTSEGAVKHAPWSSIRSEGSAP